MDTVDPEKIKKRLENMIKNMEQGKTKQTKFFFALKTLKSC